ncbi:MAG: SpoIIE family protein phosphatase, partial [Vicinamibacterales bacterium]
AAVKVFDRSAESPPARVVADAHAALRPTRGAAVASLAVDLDRGTACFAGVGNISGVILLAGGGRHGMVSHNGTAGHSSARVQEFTYPVPHGSIVVMCSDGLNSQWNLDVYPGLRARSGSVIAGVLYRDFSRRRDDVTVIVGKDRQPVAEKASSGAGNFC